VRARQDCDYEKILAKVKEVLGKSSAPEAKQQMAGWKVIKMAKPMPDGKIIYTHVITPVPGADYNILQVLYATITDPTEQKTLYDLYRGAFAGNLSLAGGDRRRHVVERRRRSVRRRHVYVTDLAAVRALLEAT
jgi:hypothetical protein